MDDEPEPEEDIRPVVAGGSRTFTLAGLGFGVVISAIVVILVFRGQSRQERQARAQKREVVATKTGQKDEVLKFQAELAEAEEKATEALARLRRSTEDAETKANALGLQLKTYATTRRVKEIAEEYDRVRGRVTGGAAEALDDSLAQARRLLSEGKPYEANELLADLPADEQGPRVDQLIAECERAIDKIILDAEQSATALAKDGKLDEAKQVLAEARRRVGPVGRRKLLELEEELGEGGP